MKFTIVQPPYDTAVDVVMRVPSTPDMCSVCDKRPPVFFMRDHDVLASPAVNDLPLGGPNSCAECLNTQLEVEWIHIVRVDPNEF